MRSLAPASAIDWFLYFAIASFIGWLLETAYKSIKEGRWVNSGFLSGPFVPIYGFGALAIAFLYLNLAGSPPLLLWTILVLAPTALEFLASWILEKAFGLRLWDYSHLRFHIKGRISLFFSLCWALLAVSAVFFVEPVLTAAIASFDPRARYFASGALSMYFFMDTVASGASFANFKAFIVDLKELVARGGSFLPSLELGTVRLPREFRRLLKPLKAFPALRRELRPALSAVPEWITAKLETIVGGRHLKK